MRDRRRRLSFLAAAALLASVLSVHSQLSPARAESSTQKPLTGGWTQNGSYVWHGTARTIGVHHAFDATLTFDWPEAAGNVFVGHSVAKTHVLMNADGTGTVRGVEMFIGTVDGRRGQTIFQVEAAITNFTDYQGTAVCLGGTGGLENLECAGSFVGKSNLTGHWTSGSYSFNE
jgi:hypothetical protein